MSTPRLIITAPVEGAAAARLGPLIAAIGARLPARLLIPGAMQRDLAPITPILPDEWDDLHALPHLHLLADSTHSAQALQAAGQCRGVAVLEDGSLHHAYRQMTLGFGSSEAWLRMLGVQHGPAASRLGRLAFEGLEHPALPRLAPMLEEVSRLSEAVVVRRADIPLPPGAHRHVLAPGVLPWRRLLPEAGLRVAGAGRLATVVARLAGAELIPPGDPRADALLALDLPFSAQDLRWPATALASGCPVLAWEASLPDDWAGVTRLPFPSDAAAVASALTALLKRPRPAAIAMPSPADEAEALLKLLF